MNNLSDTIANGFIHTYRSFAERVSDLSANMSAEQFWSKPYPYGNSFGHLTLHITGNLNYYIGAQIASTGYVRHREREFTEAAPPSKDEVLMGLNQAVEMVVATIEAQTAETWSSEYHAVGAGDAVKNRFGIFLSCSAHFQHHIGQMIFLEKQSS